MLHVPGVSRASLFLLGRLHLLPGDAETFAVREVQGGLPVYVPDDGGSLLVCLISAATVFSGGPELESDLGSTHSRDVSHILGLVARESVGAGKLYLSIESAYGVRPCGEEREGENHPNLPGRGNPGQDSL